VGSGSSRSAGAERLVRNDDKFSSRHSGRTRRPGADEPEPTGRRKEHGEESLMHLLAIRSSGTTTNFHLVIPDGRAAPARTSRNPPAAIKRATRIP
jgi:hypothetical protein